MADTAENRVTLKSGSSISNNPSDAAINELSTRA